MGWLISILGAVVNAWLSWKASVSIRLGREQQKSLDLEKEVEVLDAQAQASEESPKTSTEMEKLLEEHRG